MQSPPFPYGLWLIAVDSAGIVLLVLRIVKKTQSVQGLSLKTQQVPRAKSKAFSVRFVPGLWPTAFDFAACKLRYPPTGALGHVRCSTGIARGAVQNAISAEGGRKGEGRGGREKIGWEARGANDGGRGRKGERIGREREGG
eukprot:2580816-Rhodomonas_salina.1